MLRQLLCSRWLRIFETSQNSNMTLFLTFNIYEQLSFPDIPFDLWQIVCVMYLLSSKTRDLLVPSVDRSNRITLPSTSSSVRSECEDFVRTLEDAERVASLSFPYTSLIKPCFEISCRRSIAGSISSDVSGNDVTITSSLPDVSEREKSLDLGRLHGEAYSEGWSWHDALLCLMETLSLCLSRGRLETEWRPKSLRFTKLVTA